MNARVKGGGDYQDVEKIKARHAAGRQKNLSEVVTLAQANWATPQSRDHFPPHTPDRIAAMKAEGHGMRNLNDEAAHWMTPNVPNGGRSAAHAEQIGATLYHDGKKVQLGLEHQAKHWGTPRASDGEKGGPNMSFSAGGTPLPAQAAHWPTPMAGSPGTDTYNPAGNSDFSRKAMALVENWPTPTVSDQKGSGPTLERSDGKMRGDRLDYAAEQVFSSHQDRTTPAGPQSSETRRVLNPQFVEWLMGWPIGWTALEPVETGLSRWLLLSRSYLSTLCSPKQETQRQLL